MKNIKKDLNKVVQELLEEKNKKDPKVYTSGSGVGLNLDNDKVKNALINTVKHYNKNSKK